jgi:hypothetical protein
LIGLESGKVKGPAKGLALNLERADVSDKGGNVYRRERKYARPNAAKSRLRVPIQAVFGGTAT